MKSNYRCKFAVRVLLVLLALFFHINTVMAVAFPFREFDEGDPVPDVQLHPMEAGKPTVTFSGLKGKPFVAVFWGADLPEKAAHSAKVLGEVESLSSFFKERGVQRLSVNVQNDSQDAVNNVITMSGSSMDVYLDENQKAYATLGIFVMPTVLLVDRNGNVAAGLGYSRDLIDRLRGAVEIMLGEKTAEQVAAELRPEMLEASEEEKESRRHFNFGMVMLKRGQIEVAIREFSKAVEVAPDMSEAHLQLGCLYLRKNELELAEKSINNALAADSGSVSGKVCRGELLRLKGQLEQAASELQAVIDAHPDQYDGYYYLARVYEDQKKVKEAMDMYRKAYLVILKHSVAGK